MHADDYLSEACEIAARINPKDIERMAHMLASVRGRIFCVGLGGSLANASHMAADFRKLCHLNAVAPDNMAELTAWANDAGWEMAFTGVLTGMGEEDALFVLSVGGGTDNVSRAISYCVDWAYDQGTTIFGIVGPEGGRTARMGDCVICVPAPAHRVTAHTEAFQALLWHCLISHPLLQKEKTKW
jgi:D-sedoheptulose 7-phosphate isomerase